MLILEYYRYIYDYTIIDAYDMYIWYINATFT